MTWVVRKRWWLIGALALILAALSPFVASASRPDNSLTVWFLDSDPKLEPYHQFQERFGNDEIIVLQVHHPDGIFEPEVVDQLRQASRTISKIEGIAQVYSMLDVQRLDRVFPEGEGPSMLGVKVPTAPTLKARPLVPLRGAGPEVLEERAGAHPLVDGFLVNEDATRAVLLIQMEVMGDMDARRNAIIGEVRARADEVFGAVEHPMGGIGVIYAGLNEITTHDFGIFVSLGYLIMFIMLWVVFRSMRLVLAALGTILVGTWISLGVYGVFGHRLNTMTVVLPTVIIVLGVADAVHFPVAFLRARKTRAQGEDGVEVAARGLRAALLPCVVTTLTTAAGFLALVSSPIGVVRELGIYAALGIAGALAAAVVLMGTAFMGLGADHDLPELGWIQRGLDHTRQLVERHPWPCVALIAALCIAAGAGAAQVEIDTYTLGAFPDDHRVVQDHERIEQGWGPYSTLEFMVEPTDPDARADDPEVLAAMEAFAERARGHERVGRVMHPGQLYRYAAHTLDPKLKRDEPLPPSMVRGLRAAAQQGLPGGRGEVAPVLMMMGVMGALGIYLDIATATVAAIVIGVAIDDTVHFLHAWRERERAGAPWSERLEQTFARAGRAACVTTLLLVTGFPVLMLADVATVFDFGLLTSVAAVAALLGDLIVLPLMLRAWPGSETASEES